MDPTTKIDMPSIVPGGELAPDSRGFDYYYDQAREICRRVSVMYLPPRRIAQA